MARPDTLFLVICPSCDAELELDAEEERRGSFICPVCGAGMAVPDAKTEEVNPATIEAGVDRPTPTRAFRRRIWLSAGFALFLILGRSIPLPGSGTIDSGGFFFTFGLFSWPTVTSSLFAFHVDPYITMAAVLVLLCAILPPLRRLRDGSSAERLRFERIIFAGTIPITFCSGVWFSVKQQWIRHPWQTDFVFDGNAMLLWGVYRALLVPAVLFPLLLVSLRPVMLDAFGLRSPLVFLLGVTIPVLVAIVIHVFDRIRAEGWLSREKSERFAEGRTVRSCETEFEAKLALWRLDEAGIEGIVRCDRAITITGTAFFWSVSKPRFPSLAIHRGLGMGGVELVVAEEDEEKAKKILAEYPPRP